jgi:hypothetical protein
MSVDKKDIVGADQLAPVSKTAEAWSTDQPVTPCYRDRRRGSNPNLHRSEVRFVRASSF